MPGMETSEPIRKVRTYWACSSAVERPAHNWLRAGSNPAGPMSHGAIVYRLGRGPFKAERRVRFPLALPSKPCNHRVFRFFGA
jgi:hypothetical protein